MVTPRESHLCAGTADPYADARRIEALDAKAAERFVPSNWPTVGGELMTFDDPVTRLPPLDRLEGFNPRGGCEYLRVAGCVETSGGPTFAWYYVGDEDWAAANLKPIAGDRWVGGAAWR